MTREEFEYAIKSCGCFIYRGQTYYEESELIKAFEDMGLIEQEPSGDTISRQAVLDMWRQIICYDRTCHARDEGRCTETFCDFKLFEYQINHMSPVKPQEKTGHWIIKNGKEQGYDIAGIKTWYIQIMCDKCGFIKTAIEGHTGQYHYCPDCGVRMIEEQERSDE